MSVRLEHITQLDATEIAALHAASWKVAYRGILSDEYLDTQVDTQRAAHWRQRLATATNDSFGLVARDAGVAIGFAWVDLDNDPVHGHLLDNLHVHPDRKRGGLGRALIAAVADEVMARRERHSLFLWVYEANVAARAFYDRIGGTAIDRTLVTTLDQQSAWQWRYIWPDVSLLRSATVVM